MAVSMSSSEEPAIDFDQVRGLCAAIEDLVARDAVDTVPDDVVTSLLSAATALYARLALDHQRDMPALRPSAAVTATAVVVTVSDMLRAADLNSFDLAMWFQRPRAKAPESVIAGG
jgi:hypothetical protein